MAPDLATVAALGRMLRAWLHGAIPARALSVPPQQCPPHAFPVQPPACDFDVAPVLRNEYTSDSVRFAGPGYGALNGGVIVRKCAFSTGQYAPLYNASVAGDRALGFSALHRLRFRAGKPIGPETIRFTARATNIALQLAGIDGHSARVDLWSGAAESYNDEGELLRSYSFVLSPALQRFELVDENDIFVDCVRRVTVASDAKVFMLDELQVAEKTQATKRGKRRERKTEKGKMSKRAAEKKERRETGQQKKRAACAADAEGRAREQR